MYPSPRPDRRARSARPTHLTRTLTAAAASAFLIGAGVLGASAANASTSAAQTGEIRHPGTNTCIDARWAQTHNGNAVQTYSCNGTAAQKWKVDTSASTIALSTAPTQVLDVTDRATTDGAPIQLWAYGNGANQRWSVKAATGGTSSIVSEATGKCLTVPSGDAANGVRLVQRTCDGSAAQRFTVPAGGSTTPTQPPTQPPASSGSGLDDPAKKDIAMQLVSTAENSSLDWRAQYGYLEDIGDGRGYTGGIIGFTSGTHDMLALVEHYTSVKANNPLAAYLPALRAVDGTDSHDGLGSGFERAWAEAAKDSVFRQAQDSERDRSYFNPSVSQAKKDGLSTLGQFIYYDAIVMHGPGDSHDSFGGMRSAAMSRAKTPAAGGDETAYLSAFLDVRRSVMKEEEAHEDTSRIDTAQRVFLREKNFNLNTPLSWSMYGQPFSIR